MKEMVEITKEEYLDLLLAEAKLQALEDAGVDAWEWYDEAIQEFFDKEEEIQEMVEEL